MPKFLFCCMVNMIMMISNQGHPNQQTVGGLSEALHKANVSATMSPSFPNALFNKIPLCPLTYLKVFPSRALHQNFSGTYKIRSDKKQQKGRMIAEDVIPHAQPFLLCKNFRE